MDDDFFDLGGDSLLAAELTIEIEEQFGVTLPASTLIEATTVSSLARLLDRHSEPRERMVLVPFVRASTTTSRPRFFCVHGLGGGVVDYQRLSQALGADQPFYGLQVPDVGDSAGGGASIEEMARDYIAAMRTVQECGPYHIGGYCFGGMVAFEMARQLSAAGDEVGLVAILEAFAPDGAGERGVWEAWRFAVNFVRSLPYWLRDYLRLEGVQMQARNRRLARVVRKQLARLVGVRTELGAGDLIDGVSSFPAQLQRVLAGHIAATYRYTPAPVSSRLVLFRSSRRLLRAPAHDMGWGALSTRPVEVHLVPGSHATILDEPHVRVLAEKLAPYLRKSD